MHALGVRRDILGRRYLRPMAAVEDPQVSADGASVCFDDAAMARGVVRPDEARYEVDVHDGVATAARLERVPEGSHTCVPLGAAGPGSGYRVVEIRTRLASGPGLPGGQVTKATRIHLRWRATEGRFVVVGLERDE